MDYPIGTAVGVALLGMMTALAIGWIALKAGFPLPVEGRRLGEIDGLRGYLALFVMMDHFTVWTTILHTKGGWRQAPDLIFINFGQVAVSLFFMITGFLFFLKMRHGIAGFEWRSIYISRVCRILPLQAVVVLLVSVIALVAVRFSIGHTWFSYPARVALWMTSFGQPALFGYGGSAMVNAQVLWSLKYEWLFYLIVMPLIAVATSWRPFARNPALVSCTVFVIGYLAHLLHPRPIFIDSLPLFAIGMLTRLGVSKSWHAKAAHPLIMLVAAAGLIATVTFSSDPFHPLTILSLSLFFFSVASGGRFWGVFSSRAAIVLGECSFGIYMLHGIVLFLIFTVFSRQLSEMAISHVLLLFPACVVIVGAITIGAHLLVERPFIRIGHRLARRVRNHPNHPVARHRADHP